MRETQTKIQGLTWLWNVSGSTNGIFGLSLRQNVSWTVFGNVTYAICRWGILVILAKLMDVATVGRFALALAISEPIFMFTNLQLRAVLATDARMAFTFSDYLGLRVTTSAGALIVVAIIPMIVGYPSESIWAIVLVGLMKAIDSLSDMFYGALQLCERMDRIAKSLILKGALGLVIFGVAIFFSSSLSIGLLSLVSVSALTLLAYDIRSGLLVLPQLSVFPRLKQQGHVHPRWNRKALIQLVSISLPLGVVMMLISLNENISRYFIEGVLGERALGLFAAMAYLIVAGTTIVNAMGQAALPRFARYYAASELHRFRTLLLKLLGVTVCLSVGGVLVAWLIGREILTVIYRPEYGENAQVFVLVMVWGGIVYLASVFGYAMTAARRFRVQVPLFMLVTVATALACFLLIPRYGLWGATAAMIVGATTQLGCGISVVVHAFREPSGKPGDSKS